MKATERYIPVLLFIMLYKVVLALEAVNEILMCDNSNEGHWTVYYRYAVQDGFNF